MERGWYSDDYMKSRHIDWVDGGAPWHVGQGAVLPTLDSYSTGGEQIYPRTFTLNHHGSEHYTVEAEIKKAVEGWHGWNKETRAVVVWRTLVEKGMIYGVKHCANMIELKYEDLIERPLDWAKQLAEEYGLWITALTHEHIDKVRNEKRAGVSMESIELSERARFEALLRKLGYGKAQL